MTNEFLDKLATLVWGVVITMIFLAAGQTFTALGIAVFAFIGHQCFAVGYELEANGKDSGWLDMLGMFCVVLSWSLVGLGLFTLLF